ncbi:MAG: thioesterase family protein [Clostridia bacterium]|nr:thioesterase family protein [Clostridia bacterium]
MNELSLKIGLSSEIEMNVSEKNTAETVGSGGLDVYATPAMIALMERAAFSAVEPYLPEGYTTVGTSIQIKHVAATPVGMKVRALAELIGVEGKKLLFRVEAYDEAEKIGEGQHERYVVDSQKFRNKVYTKSEG